MIWRRVVAAAGFSLLAVTCGQTDSSHYRPTGTDPDTKIRSDISEEVTTSSTQTPLRTFTMTFTGDFLLHDRVNAVAAQNAASDPGRAYDYRPMLEPVRRWVTAADWAVCHMEVSLSSDGTRLSPYPTFRAPGQIAFDAKDLGYDSCTVASNHTLDQGLAGVIETLEVLDAAGLHSTGSARSAADASAQAMIEIQGVRVAHLAYTYWFNGFQIPTAAPWTSNLIDEKRILSDSAEARLNGAEFVVVSLHWGDQYRHQPNEQQQQLGPRLLSSDTIDLIVGHHAHVIQPIDRIDGEWLVYGLGNLLSNSSQAVRRDELLVTATVTEQPNGTFTTELQVVPLYLDHTTLTVYPTSPASRPDAIGLGIREELDASWARVLAILETGNSPDDLTIE